MKREECQSQPQFATNTIPKLPQETIVNPPINNPISDFTDRIHVPYVDTPQEAVIIGDDPRWCRNLCAFEDNPEIGASWAPNPKRLKTFEEKNPPEIRVCKFKPSGSDATPEVGAFSDSFVCEICVEPKSVYDSFGIKNCSHTYFSDCVINYVASKIQDNITIIGCPVPDCRGSLEPEHCHSILPPELFIRWGKALCEAVFADCDDQSKIFYCPFKDCSAMLIDDGGEAVRESECPHCWRLFCAQCKVPWHAEISCEEFRKLNKDERGREDLMLRKLAKDKKWRRCPKCTFYVERSEGCMFMKCRSVLSNSLIIVDT